MAEWFRLTSAKRYYVGSNPTGVSHKHNYTTMLRKKKKPRRKVSAEVKLVRAFYKQRNYCIGLQKYYEDECKKAKDAGLQLLTLPGLPSDVKNDAHVFLVKMALEEK